MSLYYLVEYVLRVTLASIIYDGTNDESGDSSGRLESDGHE